MGSKVIRNITKVFRSASGVLFGRSTAGTGRGEELTPSQVRSLLSVYTVTQTDTAISTAVNTLIGGAPGLLDTLDELSAALGDDANFAATVTNALSGKVDSSSLSESIDDRVAALLVAGTNISLTYNDASNTLTVASTGGGIGGSTGATDNAILRADGTGGATAQNSPVTIDDSGNVSGVNTLTVSDAVSATITANTVSGVTAGATGTLTNNTTNGLFNSAVKITNDVVASGSVATFNVGLQVALTTANSIGVAIVGSHTQGIFIGPSQLVASAPMTCAMHSTSTSTRQFLFNNSSIGTAGTDGTYFSQATTGEWYLINQETAGRVELYAGNGISTFILSPTTQASFVNWTTTTLKGLVLKAPASQSGNYFECQTSASAVVASISSNGSITSSALICAGTYTVGTLPSAAANAYKFANVSDSSVTTFGTTVAGGGSSKVMVYSNGTNWTVCAA